MALVPTVVMVLVPTVVMALGAAWPVMAGAQTDPSAQTDPGVQTDGTPYVQIIEQPAWIPPDGELSLTVVSSGPGDVGASVAVRIHGAVDDPADLAAVVDPGAPSSDTPMTRPDLATPVLARAGTIPATAADQEQRLTVSITSGADDDPTTIRLRAPGVHPIVVELRTPGGEVLAEDRSVITRLPTSDELASDGPVGPRLALVAAFDLPLALRPDRSHQVAGTDIDRLSRVAGLLRTLDGRPVAVAAVPDTLLALDEAGDTRANAVLEELLRPGADRDVLPQGVVPAATQALVDADLALLAAASIREGARTTDRFVTGRLLTRWWADGDGMGGGGIELLGSLGFDRFLLTTEQVESVGPTTGDDTSDPVGSVASHVDGRPRPLTVVDADGAGGRALPESIGGAVFDGRTGAWLLDPAIANGAGTEAFTVAELVLRAPSGTPLVVRVDEVPDGSRLAVLADALADPEGPLPLLGLDDLDDLNDLDDPDELDPDPRSGRDPLVLAGPQVNLSLVAERVRSAVESVDRFASLAEAVPLDGAERDAASGLRHQIFAAVGARPDPALRIAHLDAVDAATATAFGNVHLAGRVDINLTSRRGTIPLAIENENAFPIRVTLAARSDRLAFPDGDEIVLDIAPGENRIDLAVEALASGSVPVFVELRSPDGGRLLDEQQLNVRSTAISGVGLALSVGALVVLAVWWLRNWVERPKKEATEAP